MNEIASSREYLCVIFPAAVIGCYIFTQLVIGAARFLEGLGAWMDERRRRTR